MLVDDGIGDGELEGLPQRVVVEGQGIVAVGVLLRWPPAAEEASEALHDVLAKVIVNPLGHGRTDHGHDSGEHTLEPMVQAREAQEMIKPMGQEG